MKLGKNRGWLVTKSWVIGLLLAVFLLAGCALGRVDTADVIPAEPVEIARAADSLPPTAFDQPPDHDPAAYFHRDSHRDGYRHPHPHGDPDPSTDDHGHAGAVVSGERHHV